MLIVATPFHEITYSEKGAKIPSYMNFPSKMNSARPRERAPTWRVPGAIRSSAGRAAGGVRRPAEHRPRSDLGDAGAGAAGGAE